MNLNEYQAVALRTARDLDQVGNLNHAALGLTSEAGEVADVIKAHVIYGKALDVTNLKMEAGDILWFLLLLCRTMGWTLEDIAGSNLDKLKTRYPEGTFDAHRAIHKDDGAEREAVEA